MAVYTATSSANATPATIAIEVTEDGVIQCLHLEVYGSPMGALVTDIATAEASFGASPSWSAERSQAVLARLHSVASVGLATNPPPFQAARSVVLPGLSVPVRAGEWVYLHVLGTATVEAVGTLSLVVG